LICPTRTGVDAFNGFPADAGAFRSGRTLPSIGAFTRENREAVYQATDLKIVYHPATREGDLVVVLGGRVGANERVGGGVGVQDMVRRCRAT